MPPSAMPLALPTKCSGTVTARRLREIDLVEVDMEDAAGDRMVLHLAHERHALLEVRRRRLESNEVRSLEIRDVRREVLAVDGDRRRQCSSVRRKRRAPCPRDGADARRPCRDRRAFRR